MHEYCGYIETSGIRKQADNEFHDSIEKVNYGLSHRSVVY